MNDEEYTARMDQIMSALHVASALTNHITEEELQTMEETCRRADTLNFLLVHPMQLGKADAVTKVQEEAIRTLREIRAFRERTRKHVETHGYKPVDVDTATIEKLKGARP